VKLLTPLIVIATFWQCPTYTEALRLCSQQASGFYSDTTDYERMYRWGTIDGVVLCLPELQSAGMAFATDSDALATEYLALEVYKNDEFTILGINPPESDAVEYEMGIINGISLTQQMLEYWNQ